ncbi:hypothetical protein Pmar_PMAR022018 [Perkinsus marinus ATCC 50983]|uniref:Uncharacterized protein n=1 Tax=Perkinsus marinus (strain ATCC 50983 / TXsc) TaxID=423536 RepID=C5L626_PERM5|nr:hypothetical protein Pmar_PMAR022018 [Perkinsus marinus ATCC 50983]EER07811.1 hypothetical protein Pmar_PMAR022018 [Perkinsus marinus ATCC 50983]|eukprot:XP_002775995.1 hypothetical protein Pmar_PMAR022018 [Perkinsus marinus ATCC 50983]
MMFTLIIALLTVHSLARPPPPNGKYAKKVSNVTTVGASFAAEEPEVELSVSCGVGKYYESLPLKVVRTRFDVFEIAHSDTNPYRAYLAYIRMVCPRLQLKEPDFHTFYYHGYTNTIKTRVLDGIITLEKE